MKDDKAKKEHDEKCIENWRLLVGQFNQMWIERKPKEDSLKLKELVKSTHPLTYRQLDALIARCDNVMNGTYGQTKTEGHLSHSKPSQTK